MITDHTDEPHNQPDPSTPYAAVTLVTTPRIATRTPEPTPSTSTENSLTPPCVLRGVCQNTKTQNTGPLCQPKTQKHKTQALAARPKHENTETQSS